MFLALCQVTMGSDGKPETTDDPSKSDGNYEDEEAALNKTHVCDFPGCSARFSRPWKLSAHRCTHTGERPYKCKVAGCNKSYTNLTHLRRHEHGNHEGEKDSPKISEEAKLKCHHYGCYRVFSKTEYLKKHIFRKHNPNKPGINCTECNETLSDYTRLRWHMLKHKEGETVQKKKKTYPCPYGDCPDGPGTEFVDHNKLRTHLRSTHPSKFKCDSCDKVFTLKCRLKLHKLSCGSDKNSKEIKCVMDGCNHMFKFRRNMLQHVVHSHGESRYTCTYENCGKSFVWKASFKKHMRCHTLEKNVVVIVKEGGDKDTTEEDEVVENKTNEKDDVKKGSKRKRRKDALLPKQSVAELLSCVEADSCTKQMLLNRVDIEIDNNHLLLAKKYKVETNIDLKKVNSDNESDHNHVSLQKKSDIKE